MDEYEREERYNFITWYTTADREAVSKAVRTDWEKFVGLLIKYDSWIQIINTHNWYWGCEDLTL